MLLVLHHHLEEVYRFHGGKYTGADVQWGQMSYEGKCPGGRCPKGVDVQGADVLKGQIS